MFRHFVGVVIAFVLLGTPAFGAVDEVRLHVKGLACPFCVFGIEKSLKKVAGVDGVETTVRTGLVRIQPRPLAPLEAASLEEAVVKSGFTLDRIEATVTGRLITQDKQPALRAEPAVQVFLLVEDGTAGVYEALSSQTLEKLKRASGDGSRPLIITGQVHRHIGLPPALAVEEFEAAP